MKEACVSHYNTTNKRQRFSDKSLISRQRSLPADNNMPTIFLSFMLLMFRGRRDVSYIPEQLYQHRLRVRDLSTPPLEALVYSIL